MGEGKAVEVENFSHVCVGVSDMDAALAFYTGMLGMDVVFDVNLEGEGLESVTGSSGAHGRMVGGLIGGTMVELLDLGTVPANPEGPHLGYTNISFRVRDLDDTYERLSAHAGLELRAADIHRGRTHAVSVRPGRHAHRVHRTTRRSHQHR